MKIDLKNKTNIIWGLVLAIFIVLELIICPHHEHCADEAQAWLLARDASLWDIITKYVRYECTPALWHIILKIFMFFKLPYNLFYIIPIIFSSIGVGLFLFKSKFPLWIKVLFPFSYYVFYQYTVVARNYCLILPLLAGLAIIYPRKLEKPFFFALLLILFSNISSQCFIATGSIFFLYLIDFFKGLKAKEFSPSLLKQNIISIVTIAVSLILTFLIILPPHDFMFAKPFHIGLINLAYTLNILGNILVFNTNKLILDILGIILLVLFISNFYKKDFRIIQLLILICPLLLFLVIYYCADQHLGIVFLLVLFAFWIHFDENKSDFSKNNLFYILFLIILIVQINWTVKSVKYDLKYDYSGMNKAAKFIKEKIKQNSIVYGFGYEIVGIQPFFDKNIFYNHKNDKTFYIWSKSVQPFNISQIFENQKADIIIIPLILINSERLLIDPNQYEIHFLDGNIYSKNRICGNEGFLVLNKKNKY